MNRLNGKKALITGGTSGIGLETAKLFIAEGARVIVTGATDNSLETAKQALGGEVTVLASDAGNVAAQEQLAHSIREAFGTLDIVFVNAGIAALKPLEEWDEASFDRSMSINFKGPFFLLRALLPVFAKPASVILNGSINAHIGMPSTSVYGATKAAVISLAKTLSGELLPRGVRVNVVSAGPIATPLYEKLGVARNPDAMESFRKQIPAGRFGQPSEIAHAVLLFASDETAFAVGSELVIDGGMSTL